MLPDKLAFLDIETTGTSIWQDRIIEIGILRVEKNKIIRTYETLINPSVVLPDFIEQLTGIQNIDLLNAPSFYEVKDAILDIVSDCILVAHNVRFDYGFLRHEFKRHNITFLQKHFCSVKLSQQLFPQYSRHNLDSIIERYGIACPRRHRAFDDARVLVDFYNRLQKNIGTEKLAAAVTSIMKRPTRPLYLSESSLEHLPELPGVYIFLGEEEAPLYIGKSINIKERVFSHFASDYTSPKEMKIAQQVRSIETIITAGELGALLLEATLVKKMQPFYNRKLRHKKKIILVRIVRKDGGYDTACLEEVDIIDPNNLDTIIGMFTSRKKAILFLRKLAKEQRLCQKILDIEKTKGGCFAYRLGECSGACLEKEKNISYNLRFQLAVGSYKLKSWPFIGPIVITEQNELNGIQQSFMIDKWCLVGQMTRREDSNEILDTFGYSFDTDAYKILTRYILSSKKQRVIKQISQKELSSYLSGAL